MTRKFSTMPSNGGKSLWNIVNFLLFMLTLTRTTYVVRNAGCAGSRYTLKFFFNQSMNQWMN